MKSPISDFTDIRSVGAAVIYADTKKPTGDFCDYANAPRNRSKTRGQDYTNYLQAGHHNTVTATNSKTEC